MTKIAVEHQYKIGAQLPLTVYHQLFFGDQNWKNPRRREYMDALGKYKPTLATVLDLEREEQYAEVMSWAEQATVHVEKIIIIPKYNGAVSKLPRKVNDKEVVLGFSVPTKYAGTTVPTDEFKGWPVHLLGGNPFQQLAYSKKMSVTSVDCNFHLKMANRFCQFFSLMPKYGAQNPDWPTLLEADGKKWGGNGRFEAFRRSCVSIQDFWRFHGFRVTV